jgi:carboxypeptidase Taq
MSDETFLKLKKRIQQVGDLGGAAGLLGWDQRTYMPPKGAATRGERLATLAELAHEIFTSDETGDLLDQLEDYAASQPADSDDAALWRLVKRNYDKEKVIPAELTAEISRAAIAGYQAWAEARPASDYATFLPALERNIDLLKQVVRLQREANPSIADDYDVLLDDYEPGLTVEEVTRVFDRMKEATTPLVKQVSVNAAAVSDGLVHGSFPVAQQDALVRKIVHQLGFEDDSWRLDVTEHPFASPMAVQDIRLTTKFEEDFLNPALFGTMHEFGHGLYERNVAPELERTPMARGASMAWHESQSRMWENLVGRGRPFWKYGLPKLQEAFPGTFDDATADDLYKAVNTFGPSLIRIEADELTYNLHIIIRFELERDLFSGAVSVRDLPEAWNARIRDYLGIDVPNDANGVLQDVHWGTGSFGYFPTYALGNVLAAQLWERILADIPDIERDFEQGEFGQLRTWLAENIHRHGRKYMPMDLLDKVLGVKQLDPEPLIRYLTTKVNYLYA